LSTNNIPLAAVAGSTCFSPNALALPDCPLSIIRDASRVSVTFNSFSKLDKAVFASLPLNPASSFIAVEIAVSYTHLTLPTKRIV